ncbi:MAG: four helix bundle protein [Ardenticatenaceae bacterium]|nr:four helix bundle protein [Ardenticatenaceae bacterium]MCB8986410.1 four helix bundle protein [Ardenticatenaceae bacterium]
MQNFRQLLVWQKSHELVLRIYGVTQAFPASEVYGLSNQMRRASVSVPSNIAEGSGRGSDKEFAQFMQIAIGSISELEYQALLAKDLGYMSITTYNELSGQVSEVKRMLIGLRKKLKANSF